MLICILQELGLVNKRGGDYSVRQLESAKIRVETVRSHFEELESSQAHIQLEI